MSPEDDHLQGDQVTSNGDGGRSHDNNQWSTNTTANTAKSPKNNANVHQSVGSNNNGYINSNAILKQSGGDSHTWLPLLSHHNNHHLHQNNHHTNEQQQQPQPSPPPMTNNNKWPVLTAPANLTNSKYMWRELPQDDDSMGLYKPKMNLSASANAAVLASAGNRNGSSAINGKKSEHESLTGVKRHSLNDYSNDDDDEFYERSECGVGFCKPRWARKFASTHVFMVIFLLAWILQVSKPFFFSPHYFNFITKEFVVVAFVSKILCNFEFLRIQGMYATYFVSVITTIEKLFQIKSKITGLLMSATEVGQICTSLFLTYFAGRGHRPRWIACGKCVCFMLC